MMTQQKDLIFETWQRKIFDFEKINGIFIEESKSMKLYTYF